jgi:hypothetical protein
VQVEFVRATRGLGTTRTSMVNALLSRNVKDEFVPNPHTIIQAVTGGPRLSCLKGLRHIGQPGSVVVDAPHGPRGTVW